MKSISTRHDGTSQAQRALAALQPTYFALDERSMADLIRYGQKHAALLQYYDQNNTLAGNWSAFLEGDADEMAAFMEDPASFELFPKKKAQYSRPHLALFLVFLKLLRASQKKLNTLPKEQLDFYYRQALGFVTKPAQADQVHVVAVLNEKETEVLIPQGTLLEAGTDSNGDLRHYQTNHDLVANQATIAALKSLFVEKDVTDIPLLRFKGQDELDGGFLAILQLVYRQKGTANTARNYPNNLATDRALDQTLVEELDALAETITEKLHLRVAAFQQLMKDYHLWYSPKAWQDINALQLQVLKQKNTRATIRQFTDPRNFAVNFEKALGFATSGLKEEDNTNVFDGIPNVENLYDFYENFSRSPQDQVLLDFITQKFAPLSVSQFKELMDKRLQRLSLMERIHQILNTAAQKREHTPKVWTIHDYEKDKTLALAFAKILGVTGMAKDEKFVVLEQQLTDLETYFQMKVEDYFFVRKLYRVQNTTDVPAWKWQKADQLLLQAYQQLSPDSVAAEPEITRWKNLYQANDATQVLAAVSTEKEPHPRWETFGATPSADTDAANHFAADIGWSISSPSLALAEGTRTLSLSLSFSAPEFKAQAPTLKQYLKNWTANSTKKGPYPFRIEVSTKKGWVALADWSSFKINANQAKINIVVVAGEEMDAFAPLAAPENQAPWPSLRLLLTKEDLVFEDANGQEQRTKVYELFQNQSLESCVVDIRVDGLKSLQLQTKAGSVDSKKPFDPFGVRPELGDRLFLTHPELARQKLASLTIDIVWKNLPPAGLTKYYEPYKPFVSPAITHNSFKVQFTLVEGRRRMKLAPNAHTIFPGAGKSNHQISTTKIPDTFPGRGVAYLRNETFSTAEALLESDRFLELELQGQDFLHAQYPAFAQRVAFDNIAKVKADKAPVILPEPYQPTIKEISVNYETSLHINWLEADSAHSDQAFHCEPFGQKPLQPRGRAVPFLPNFTAEGNLYIGLANLRPPQHISFLVQVAEGSANPDLTPAPIQWSYLSEHEWIPLTKEQLLLDTTQGLLSSGLVRVYLPEQASQHHQRMPSGLHWLRAQVESAADSLSDCIAIKTQGISATWIDPGKASDHLTSPLSAGTITQTVEPLSGLSEVQQPYSSFFGKAAEVDTQLYRRCSARLRHKQRALTIWDYENLVLEAFPDVYKVKVISADLWNEHYEPGKVSVIIIPDIRQRRPFDPFEPKMPVVRLREIESFLQKKAPAFARIEVRNPRFWYLQLRLVVRFHDMNNFGFYAKQLNQELLEYLAPWAYDNAADITFGGRIYPSILVDFIETRPYVNYIDKPGIALLARNADGVIRVIENPPKDEEGLLYIDEPDIIIVSAHQHFIEYLALPQETTQQEVRAGIGFAKIAFDFQVAAAAD